MRGLGLPGMETVERGERGIALVMVLIGLTLLLTVAGQFAAAMRLEGITTLNFRATLSATYLAEAAYQRAVAEILPNYLAQELDQQSLLVFRRAQIESPKAPAREDLALGPGRFSYRITDEQARFNLNSALATPENLHRLLSELGVDHSTRDVIVDSILDWRDPNEDHRLNGAESDYYLSLPVPYRSKNADFDSVEELLQVQGMTRQILYGQPGSPGLAEYVTVVGANAINVNTVSPLLLRALGCAQPEADVLIAGRAYLSPQSVTAQCPRGVQRVVRSETFRIEATGEVPGQGRRTLVAIVQRKRDRDGTDRVTPLRFAWNVEEESR
jgi:general secretion pathway protein K